MCNLFRIFEFVLQIHNLFFLGEAIGINSMKVTPGISFAIPIDYAKEFLNNSKQKRLSGKLNQHKRRRFLGITMLPITSQIIGELRSRMHIPAHVVNGIVVYRIGMSIFHIRGDTLRPLKIYLYEKLSDLANFSNWENILKREGNPNSEYITLY